MRAPPFRHGADGRARALPLAAGWRQRRSPRRRRLATDGTRDMIVIV